MIADRRAAFDVPAEVGYFNTATMAPHLRAVRAAGEAALERRGRPWTIAAADWFADVERLRSLFARIIGASADPGVALVPATSYGFAIAARNLPLRAGRRVLVLAEEYPSGVYTWRAAARRSGAEVLAVTRAPAQTWTDAVLAVLDERVAIVSVPNVHWTDGALVELGPIAARSRELGARLVIDASQSAGAMALDVDDLQPDFLVTVGHKWLLGPFGLGYLYVAGEHRQGAPLEENWIAREGSEDFAQLVHYPRRLPAGRGRFDVGGRTNFELTPMAIAALEQILEWQVARVAGALAERTSEIARRAAALGLAPMADSQRGPHLLGVRLSEPTGGRAIAALAECNCFVAMRGASLRISPHLHTTDADVERLFDGLALAIAGAPRSLSIPSRNYA